MSQNTLSTKLCLRIRLKFRKYKLKPTVSSFHLQEHDNDAETLISNLQSSQDDDDLDLGNIFKDYRCFDLRYFADGLWME